MPDIITVSDSLERLNAKTRSKTETVEITDQVIAVKLGTEVSKSVTQTVQITEDNTITQRAKTRLISEATTIAETLTVYKNGIELVPPQEIATPQNIIGTRERRVRAVRRPPRAIVIDEIKNVAIAALKLLAFSDSNNKAIVGIGIKPRPTPNVALSGLSLTRTPSMRANSPIKTQLQPMELKATLALSLPLSSLNLTTAKLKLGPQVQSIHALKAVNFEKMHKLTRIMKIAMLAETL